MNIGNATLGSGIAGGIVNLGLGIGNAINQSNQHKQNLQFQKDVFNYQKQLQREIFQREDTAIARRAKDIASAGGNPAMAWETGNGAGAGQSVPVDAPQGQAVDFSNIANSSLSQISGGINQFMQYKLQDAEIKNLTATAAKTSAETITESIRQKQLELLNAKTIDEQEKIKAEISNLNYTLDYAIDHNLPINANTNSIYNSAKDMLSNLSDVIPSNLDNMDTSSLISLATDIGLTVLPGFAALKVGSLGIKGLKAALTYIRSNRGINTAGEFITTYKKLTGKVPSAQEITLFRQGIKQSVPYKDNPQSKSYYYRKYRK